MANSAGENEVSEAEPGMLDILPKFSVDRVLGLVGLSSVLSSLIGLFASQYYELLGIPIHAIATLTDYAQIGGRSLMLLIAATFLQLVLFVLFAFMSIFLVFCLHKFCNLIEKAIRMYLERKKTPGSSNTNDRNLAEATTYILSSIAHWLSREGYNPTKKILSLLEVLGRYLWVLVLVIAGVLVGVVSTEVENRASDVRQHNTREDAFSGFLEAWEDCGWWKDFYGKSCLGKYWSLGRQSSVDFAIGAARPICVYAKGSSHGKRWQMLGSLANGFAVYPSKSNINTPRGVDVSHGLILERSEIVALGQPLGLPQANISDEAACGSLQASKEERVSNDTYKFNVNPPLLQLTFFFAENAPNHSATADSSDNYDYEKEAYRLKEFSNDLRLCNPINASDIQIVGYASSSGEIERNEGLSYQRAKYLHDVLISSEGSAGPGSAKITIGHGTSNPLSGTRAIGRIQDVVNEQYDVHRARWNRRVEVKIHSLECRNQVVGVANQLKLEVERSVSRS